MSLFSRDETVGSSHYGDKRPSSFSADRISVTIRCNAVMSVTISPQLLGTGCAHNIWSLIISAVASALGLLLALPRRRPLWPNQPGRKVAPSWYLGTRTLFLPQRLLWAAIPIVTASTPCLAGAVLFGPNQPGRKFAPSWYVGTRTLFLPQRLLWVVIPAVTASKQCLVGAVLWNSGTISFSKYSRCRWLLPRLRYLGARGVRVGCSCGQNIAVITFL
jgi:hypothetical protein